MTTTSFEAEMVNACRLIAEAQASREVVWFHLDQCQYEVRAVFRNPDSRQRQWVGTAHFHEFPYASRMLAIPVAIQRAHALWKAATKP